jgi:hypothetical protein
MAKADATLAETAKELERLIQGRPGSPIEVKYDSIHLQLTDNISNEDIDIIYRTLDAHSKPVQRWRVQKVNKLLLLSVATEESERE